MSESEFVFIGFEAMEPLIRRWVVEAGYLVLQDRTVRGEDEIVGRFELTLEEARWYADDPDAVSSVEDTVRGAVKWLREAALRYAIGDVRTRYRLRIYAPKGAKMLASGHFLCVAVEEIGEHRAAA